MTARVKSKLITLRQITQFKLSSLQKDKVIGIWFNNQYLKLRNLKLHFIKSNISTFSDFKLNLFSTVLFATLKTRSQTKIAVPVWFQTGTSTGPNSTGTATGPDSGRVLVSMLIKHRR